VITSATALVYPTNKIVQQTMEALSMLVVLLAFAALPTRLVVVQATVTVDQTKYATLTTSATVLAWDTIKVALQTMEALSMLVVLLAFAAIPTRLVVVQATVTALQTKHATLTTSATVLAWDTDKVVQQTMEALSMLVVLLAFAALPTRLVVVQATVTALRTKHARSLRICVLLKSICFLRIVSWVRMERKLLQEWHLM